jgi:hypothetical protein
MTGSMKLHQLIFAAATGAAATAPAVYLAVKPQPSIVVRTTSPQAEMVAIQCRRTDAELPHGRTLTGHTKLVQPGESWYPDVKGAVDCEVTEGAATVELR